MLAFFCCSMNVIACKVFYYELNFLAKELNLTPKFHFLEQSLHDSPEQLSIELQRKIDELEADNAEEIAICYGLCGRSVTKIRSKRAVLIIPKAHDCIGLLLGTLAPRDGSVFWMSPGWVELSQLPFIREKQMRFEQNVEKYGLDNAEYLLSLENSWLEEYKTAQLILWENMHIADKLQEQAKFIADNAKLHYQECAGNQDFLKSLLLGGNDERFFRLLPGQFLDINSEGNVAIF